MTQEHLQLIANHFNSTKGQFTTGADLFSKLSSKLGKVNESTFRCELSKAVSTKQLTNLLGVRKKGYTANGTVTVSGAEQATVAKLEDAAPVAEPAKATLELPKAAPIKTPPKAPETVVASSSALRLQTRTPDLRKLGYAWVGRECYSYMPYQGHLVEFLLLFCDGAPSDSGDIVVECKHYQGSHEKFRKLLRSRLFAGRHEGNCDPQNVPDIILDKADLKFDIAS